MSEPEEDDELARRAGDGDARAFAELVRRYRGRLYSFLSLRLGRAEAEDAFQEVCVKLWTHLAGYEPRGRFPAWLFTIARRAALDRAERLSRREVPLEGEGGAPGLPEPAPGPDRLAESEEARRRVDTALASLPAEQREVFLLREYGGLAFREIAALQGCPLGTSLARMRYALAKLRALLGRSDA